MCCIWYMYNYQEATCVNVHLHMYRVLYYDYSDIYTLY